MGRDGGKKKEKKVAEETMAGASENLGRFTWKMPHGGNQAREESTEYSRALMDIHAKGSNE